jgi:NAD-dependent dihydropyrimidine dehydrogenase PreA subunit
MAQETYAGVPRDKIDWFPTIDPTLCQPQNCRQECVEACPRDIYERTSAGNVIVACPYECTVGDISCSFKCHLGAISFPSREELKQMLQHARKDLEQGVKDESSR